MAQRFTDKFIAATKQLKVGNGLTRNVDIGPMISQSACDSVHNLVVDSINIGAKIAYSAPSQYQGYYPPTVLINVSPDMPIATNEIFGPVVPIIEFEDEKQVIEMANDTEFGLAAYVYTRDIGKVWRTSEALEYGIVGVNEGIISNPAAPFGGIKSSGNGREGSKYGLDDYTELKYICMGGLQ